jgi:hypothetical protein
MYVGAFKASFTYQDVGGGGADGFAFCLQNDTRGPSALGGSGGALGVSGITPSAEFTFNIYDGSANGPGTSFGINGANGNPFTTNEFVNLASGDPIAVTIVYQNGAAQLTLTDTTTTLSYSTNMAVGNLPAIVGGQTAYVGFVGADGGVVSTQTITGFEYVPLTTLSARASGGNLVLSWPVVPAGYTLQSKPTVSSATWQNVNATITQVGGQNVVTLPLTGTQQYYRLNIAVPAQ